MENISSVFIVQVKIIWRMRCKHQIKFLHQCVRSKTILYLYLDISKKMLIKLSCEVLFIWTLPYRRELSYSTCEIIRTLIKNQLLNQALIQDFQSIYIFVPSTTYNNDSIRYRLSRTPQAAPQNARVKSGHRSATRGDRRGRGAPPLWTIVTKHSATLSTTAIRTLLTFAFFFRWTQKVFYFFNRSIFVFVLWVSVSKKFNNVTLLINDIYWLSLLTMRHLYSVMRVVKQFDCIVKTLRIKSFQRDFTNNNLLHLSFIY